jgi:putative peptidoglycan lipid II flippase
MRLFCGVPEVPFFRRLIPLYRGMARPVVLLRAIATVGGYTMLSRVLGFVRDILIAATLGASPVADAFFVAFKLPNFFRRLFAEGAFNAGFVPLFSGLLQSEGPDRARAFAQQALAVLLVTLLIFVSLFQALMPWVMLGLAPGFVDEPAKFELTVQLTRLTFPYLLFISLVSLLAGVLNSLGRFAAAAATPVLLNLCLIGAVLWLAPHTPTAGHALAWGVALAGMVQLLWLLAALHREGWRLRLPRPRLTPRVRELLRLMAPAAVGAGVVQINLVIDIVLASLLPSGSVSYLFYADRLNQLPIGVVGVAVGTALLPLLSRQIAAGEDEAANESQNRAVEFALLLSLPAAAALMVIAEPTLRVLFERGAFGPAETQATALALIAYAVGLPAYVLVKVLTPGFFARLDTRTPVLIASLCVGVNLVLNLLLMGPMKHAGLALATALSAWLNTYLLARVLYGRGHFRPDAGLYRRLGRMIFATALMALLLALLATALAGPLAGGTLARVPALVLLVLAGLVGYGAAAQLCGAARLTDLKRFLGRDG